MKISLFLKALLIISLHTISNLPMKNDELIRCSICQESITHNSWVLGCGTKETPHAFHKICLETHIETSTFRYCPLCRQPIPLNTKEWLLQWSPEIASLGGMLVTYGINILQNCSRQTSLLCALIGGLAIKIILRKELNEIQAKTQLRKMIVEDEDLVMRYQSLLTHHILTQKALKSLSDKYQIIEADSKICEIKKNLISYINRQPQPAGKDKEYFLTLISLIEYNQNIEECSLKNVLRNAPSHFLSELIEENLIQISNIESFRAIQNRNCKIIRLVDLLVLKSFIKRNIPSDDHKTIINPIRTEITAYLTQKLSDNLLRENIKNEFEQNLLILDRLLKNSP